MKVAEIMRLFRREIKDTAKPYLCSPEQALDFLNQACTEAARRARLIVDSSSDIAQVPVSAGISLVDLSPKIISIRRMRLQSSAARLTKRLVREMDEMAPGWDTSTQTSQPSTAVIDFQTDALFLYPAPKADDVLLMTVTREPLSDVEQDDDRPEINARYHLALIEWMKFKTYTNEDTDLYDEKKAAVALKRFEDEFGPATGAANERFEFERYDDVGER